MLSAWQMCPVTDNALYTNWLYSQGWRTGRSVKGRKKSCPEGHRIYVRERINYNTLIWRQILNFVTIIRQNLDIWPLKKKSVHGVILTWSEIKTVENESSKCYVFKWYFRHRFKNNIGFVAFLFYKIKCSNVRQWQM